MAYHRPIKASSPGALRHRLDLSEITPPDWHADAACRGLESLSTRWTIPDFPGGGSLSEDQRAALWRGQTICRTQCPVKAECLADASDDDRLFTIRGGELPGSFSGQTRGRPATRPQRVKPKREPVEYCVRGHHRPTVGVRSNGHCVACYKIAQDERTERRRRERGATETWWITITPRKALTAVLTAEQVHSGVCPQGHPVSPSDGSLVPSGQCKACYRTATAAKKKEIEIAAGRATGVGRTKCRNGHVYTEGSFRIGSHRPGRICLICEQERSGRTVASRRERRRANAVAKVA